MNTREQLAEVIRDGEGTWQTPLEAADAILKALAPREVTTVAELDALGFEAVVLDPCGTPAVCQRSTQTESFWELGGIGASDLIDSDTLLLSGSSCTVLHEGDVSHRAAVKAVAE